MASKNSAPKAPAAEPGKALVPTPEDEAAVDVFNDEMLGAIAEQEGAGLGNIGAQDKAIPFIGLVQSLSPQRDKTSEKYIPGAEEGDIFNTVTGELFKDGVLVVPVEFKKTYNVWIPRDAGGGFLGSYLDPECTIPAGEVRQNTRDYDGPRDVKATANHYLLVLGADGTDCTPALLALTSTQLTASRKWCSQMSMVRIRLRDGRMVEAPTFVKAYRLTSVRKENEKGVFYNFVITADRWVDEDIFVQAVAFRKSITGGAVVVDPARGQDAPAGAAAAAASDEEAPF